MHGITGRSPARVLIGIGVVLVLAFTVLYFRTALFSRPPISVALVESVWQREERFAKLPPPRPLVSGYPLIQTKGMVSDGKYLYISDTGKDQKHKETAKIWRLDPTTGKLDLFFSGPLLVNSKWLFFHKGEGGTLDELIISDFGEEPAARSRWLATGKGAKVFAIPINSDGTAGKPRILHAGSPLRTPEGLTVIGDAVLVADVSGGEKTTRPERPGVEFISGSLFQIPLRGGPPERIAADHKWVTLIGVCGYPWLNLDYIMLIDLDSGRLDRSRLAALPQSGAVEIFRLKIKSKVPFQAGELERVILTEDGSLTLKVANLPSDHTILLVAGAGTTFPGRTTERVLKPTDFSADGTYKFVVRTDTSVPTVTLKAIVRNPAKATVATFDLQVPKDPDQEMQLADNKHAGSLTRPMGAGLKREFYASPDGTTQSVSLFTPYGGTPIRLWKGAPLKQPIAVMFSADGRKLYVTDQAGGPNGTGAVWVLDLPPANKLVELLGSKAN